MPEMKTPEERGPFGWWAYETRADILDLSPEAVVLDLGKYHPATLRKAESNPEDMSGPLWRALVPYYQRIAKKRGIILRQPPVWGASEPPAIGDMPALIDALTEQTTAINRLASALENQAKLDAKVEDVLTIVRKTWLGEGALADMSGAIEKRLGALEDLLRGAAPSGSASTGSRSGPRPSGARR